jgi:peptidoglycan/LPS O-acetylase OafA/YrhL
METKPTSHSPERLPGIEWMRGLAAFGVICIHSGIAVHNNTTEEAGFLRDLCNFAVPFFLILSFFFAVRAEMTSTLPWRAWLRKRADRLLVPFVFWSLVYLILHIAKLAAHRQFDDVIKLISEPAELILTGGTSVALYFIPLLFTGLVLIRLLSNLLKQISIPALAIAFGAGIVFQHLFIMYVPDAALQGWIMAPLDLCFGLFLGALRCLPLIFAAAILARILSAPGGRNAVPLIAAGILVVTIMDLTTLPLSLSEPALAVGALLVAWGLSGVLPTSPLASTVGLFSFGIYLVHQFFLEIIQIAIPYHGIIGVGGTLFISAATFAASMVAVGVASRCGVFANQAFGLK